jgi:hypothetical protein
VFFLFVLEVNEILPLRFRARQTPSSSSHSPLRGDQAASWWSRSSFL